MPNALPLSFLASLRQLVMLDNEIDDNKESKVCMTQVVAKGLRATSFFGRKAILALLGQPQ